MQIDFHHATTYVAARLAGFPQDKAKIVAHAAQYVDDATSSGTVRFKNKFLYDRISSAHKMIDTRNTRDLANHQVWIPFHFLPGNGGLEADKDSGGKPVDKLVCQPNSPVAKEMVSQAIKEHQKPYALHRLGVTMHVYADTWAHQGFAGLLDNVNEVEDAKEIGKSGVFNKIGNLWRDLLDDTIPPLGHGRATIFPDMPFLQWQYENHEKVPVNRDNTKDFCEAANEMCMAMQRFIAKDPNAPAKEIGGKDMEEIIKLFVNTKGKEGDDRHKTWLAAIKNGVFSFGAEQVEYITDRDGSWKHQALGTTADLLEYTYKKTFLTSNWKLFNDAAQAHRFYVIYDLLPKFGICAA